MSAFASLGAQGQSGGGTPVATNAPQPATSAPEPPAMAGTGLTTGDIAALATNPATPPPVAPDPLGGASLANIEAVTAASGANGANVPIPAFTPTLPPDTGSGGFVGGPYY
jgi:hypothetical protein